MARDTAADITSPGLPMGPSGIGPPPPAPAAGLTPGYDPGNPQHLTGQQRFAFVLSVGPAGDGGNSSEERDKYILSLPEDPNDLQYTQLLRDAKDQARSRAPLPPGERGSPTNPKGGPRIAGITGKAPLADTGPMIHGGTPPQTGANPGSPGTKKLDLEEERQHRQETAGAPVIMGLPVTVQDTGVKPNPNNPGGTPDPFVAKWVKDEALPVTNDEAAIAAKSGQWVYTGEVADPSGGKFYTRSQYVYVDEAKSQLSGLSSDEIKKYQKQLDEPQTGIPSPTMQNLWENAVYQGQQYAMAGKKVTLKYIFDTLVAAKASASSGGGGGLGPFGNESGADMVGADYYQAMMQVLGDISGVKK